MTKKVRLSPEHVQAFKEGSKRGKVSRGIELLVKEEVRLLREALYLDKFDEIPDGQIIFKDQTLQLSYEDKVIQDIKKLENVHDPAGTRDDIEAKK